MHITFNKKPIDKLIKLIIKYQQNERIGKTVMMITQDQLTHLNETSPISFFVKIN